MRTFKHALVLTTLENLALTMIRTLAAKGIKATVAGAGPGRLLRLSRHCSAFVPVARGPAEYAQAKDQAVERAASLAQQRGIDLIVPVDVAGGMFAEKLKARLPGPTYFPSAASASLRRLDNKWTFYGLLCEHGLPAPRTQLLENAEQARGLPLPLVLKPLSEAGGAGVCVAQDEAQREARLGGTSPQHRFPTLAQEYVDGEDVSLSFLADRGRLLAWAAHMRRSDGSVDYVSDERVVELGRGIARAADYTGVANVDMRYDGPGRERVLVLECNPRFWGTYKYTLGLGVDFLERGLGLAAGSEARPFVAPRAVVPGLVASVKRLARGRPVPSESRPYLRQKMSDPLPELYSGARSLLGLRGWEP